jgi:holo-[acyl-carrier protein] synthase
MIVGHGIDIIEVERMGRTLERFGPHFLQHVFTLGEQGLAPETEKARTIYFAGRWAAKEAVAKALKTGIGRDCAWKDLEVLRGPQGEPVLNLTGVGAQTAAKLGIDCFHLSISHEGRLACASAIAEKN